MRPAPTQVETVMPCIMRSDPCKAVWTLSAGSKMILISSILVIWLTCCMPLHDIGYVPSPFQLRRKPTWPYCIVSPALLHNPAALRSVLRMPSKCRSDYGVVATTDRSSQRRLTLLTSPLDPVQHSLDAGTTPTKRCHLSGCRSPGCKVLDGRD